MSFLEITGWEHNNLRFHRKKVIRRKRVQVIRIAGWNGEWTAVDDAFDLC